MEDYLKEIEFAVTPIIQAIWHEQDELEGLDAELNRDFKKFFDEIEAIKAAAKDPEDARAACQIWQAASEHDRRVIPKDEKFKVLKGRAAIREFAVAALSGSLLQFAKQGISIVHGKSDSCPNGRVVGPQTLKSLILHGRNQALHWEEFSRPNPRQRAAKECFRRLALEVSLDHFGPFNSKNLGSSVIGLLGWRTFENFKSDLFLLS